jgi:Flp pilus assembly pilin Flp
MKRILVMKKAQSLIEYGLILALVAVVAVTILGKFSTSINKVGTQANSAVSASGSNAMCNYCKQTDDETKCLTTAGLTSGDCPDE